MSDNLNKPIKNKLNKGHKLSFRIDNELLREMESVVSEEDISKSKFIVQSIKNYIEKSRGENAERDEEASSTESKEISRKISDLQRQIHNNTNRMNLMNKRIENIYSKVLQKRNLRI